MKKPKMFHRPLIPILFSFTAGILVSYRMLPSCHCLFVPLFLSMAGSLLASLFLSSRLKMFCLLFVFFLTGILLEQGKYSTSKLIPLAIKRTEVTLEGTVLEPVRTTKKMARLTVRADVLFIEVKGIPINDKVFVSVYDHIQDIRPGEKIRFPARLRPFKNFNNPGRYDYESAMKLKGFVCAASVSDGRRIVPMGPGHLPFPRGLIERIQRPARAFFKKNLNTQNYALFRALILGERQGIDQALREPFNQTGLGHVLAVSGLHIGLIAWAAFFLFKWVLSRSYSLTLRTDIRKLSALLTCLPVIGYAFLAGCQVSSQRAMIMVLTFLWSLILGREREVWSTLALAALLVLAIDPHAIFGISFQLSFSAVIGILWLTPPLLKKGLSPIETIPIKSETLKRLLTYFIGLIVVSISATIFLTPLTVFYFHRACLVTIPVNLMVVPLMGFWILPLGLLCVATLPFSFEVAGFFVNLGAWGLSVLMEIIRFWASLSWSSFWVITPNPFEILMSYCLMLFLFFFKRWSWAKKGLLVLAVFIAIDVGYWTYRVGFNRKLKVTFLDVGQANAALVEFPMGKKMLIDGGGFPRDHFDVGKMVVAPYLWHSKIQRIDYLVLSHPQADHMNGLRFIAGNFHPKEFWYNGDEVDTASFKELMAIVESKKIKRLLPNNLVDGREITGVNVEILHPIPGTYPTDHYDRGTKLNNNSLVLKITYNAKAFLFPGDLERQGEDVLISNAGPALQSHILLSPHHGSKSSSSEEFLRMVRPSICVISSGEDNFFGFPHQQTLKRLRNIGCRIIRIDQAGAVQCTVGPHAFEISTFL